MTTTTELEKLRIQYVAKRLDCSFIEACQKMQSVAAKHGKSGEKIIQVIHKIKMQYISERISENNNMGGE
tara:strand:+ start:14439 stop:14648 length:210 start_codon:yes stop_codon:yes gene_type:complete